MICLPSILASGMVLQRDTPATLWGNATENECFTISFQDKIYKVAPINHTWILHTEPLTLGGPFELTLESEHDSLTLHDIYVGDVWLCSGQSNMELTFDRLKDTYPEELVKSSPYLRQFKIPANYDLHLQHNDIPDACWTYANPDTILQYSGTAYFFGQKLSDTYNVPIGLINASMGGSTIECWLDEHSIANFPYAYELLQQYKDDSYRASIEQKNQSDIQHWYDEIEAKDIEVTGLENPNISWHTIELPGYLSERGLPNYYGSLWLRKTIFVPSSMLNKQLSLWLGRIVDKDVVFINGQYVGDTGYEYPPRKYTVPANLLHEGENTLYIHLYCNHGNGGLIADKRYELFSDSESIDLTGQWEYTTTVPMDEYPEQFFPQWLPTGLFNAMIAPITNFTIKGIVWYQGEANVTRASTYAEALKTLIRLWRHLWHNEDLPFVYAELPNYQEPNELPNQSTWAALREAQLAGLYLKHTAMAVTFDLGEWNDLHPLNKKGMGYRLANLARGLAYHEDIPYKTPTYSHFDIYGNKIVISFKHLNGGLTTTNQYEPTCITAAGIDGIYHDAHAMIDNNHLYVWCDDIIQIKYIRYAWADNPSTANLCNKAGLLVSPFQVNLIQ